MSLEKLQEIRERRLEKQQKVVQQSKSLVDTAAQQLELCKQNLLKFQQWRQSHQENLFRSMQGQPFSPQNMIEYRAELDNLGQEEEQLKQVIIEAQKKLEVTHKNYAQCREVATTLALKNEKTKEIVKIQQKAEKELQRSLD
jgi:transposase-like protein